LFNLLENLADNIGYDFWKCLKKDFFSEEQRPCKYSKFLNFKGGHDDIGTDENCIAQLNEEDSVKSQINLYPLSFQNVINPILFGNFCYFFYY
jgi:hypothetical protein